MAETLQDVAAGLVSHLPESNPDRQKMERTVEQYDDAGLAKFLNDRGALSPELQKKYGLNRLGSNVSASEIPEEAPDYQGDVGLAADAGLKPAPLDPSLLNAGTEPIQPDDEEEEADGEEVVEDYNDLTVKRLNEEISRRNSDRDDESQIVPDGNAKSDLVAALEADDEQYG
jgi:hypothetical protein